MAVALGRFIGHGDQWTRLRRAEIKEETDQSGHGEDTVKEDLQAMGVTGTRRSEKRCKRSYPMETTSRPMFYVQKEIQSLSLIAVLGTLTFCECWLCFVKRIGAWIYQMQQLIHMLITNFPDNVFATRAITCS